MWGEGLGEEEGGRGEREGKLNGMGKIINLEIQLNEQKSNKKNDFINRIWT